MKLNILIKELDWKVKSFFIQNQQICETLELRISISGLNKHPINKQKMIRYEM